MKHSLIILLILYSSASFSQTFSAEPLYIMEPEKTLWLFQEAIQNKDSLIASNICINKKSYSKIIGLFDKIQYLNFDNRKEICEQYVSIDTLSKEYPARFIRRDDRYWELTEYAIPSLEDESIGPKIFEPLSHTNYFADFIATLNQLKDIRNFYASRKVVVQYENISVSGESHWNLSLKLRKYPCNNPGTTCGWLIYNIDREETNKQITADSKLDNLPTYNSLKMNKFEVEKDSSRKEFECSTFIEIEIKKGDTLFFIAERYGASIEHIMKCNKLKSDIIIAGKKLKIPIDSNQ